MNVTLTWDLFIIVFFAMVMAYSYLIGRHQAAKIIFASYIAIIAVQGLGNIAMRMFGQAEGVLQIMQIAVDSSLIIAAKMVLFIIAVILLALRSGMTVVYTKRDYGIVNAITTGIFGFVTAGLLISTLVTYLTESLLLDVTLAEAVNVSPIIQQSSLMQSMIIYQDLWFAMPALAILVAGFFASDSTASTA
jgi:hypothetical protein